MHITGTALWATWATLVFADSTNVKLDSGPIAGKDLPSGIKFWTGIPFAKSPPERFGRPENPAPWKDTYKATVRKPACMQQFKTPASARDMTIKLFSNPNPEESEDCLYANVWAPKGAAPEGGWPVMFWIYGGNLQIGDSALEMYNGEKFAQKDVIVVSANYRTNVFGFANSPLIPVEDQNLGFHDQRKALDWVQRNIASFGGNPKKVLIFGESAGGFSVKQLIASPPSPLPFAAAIMQSPASGVHGNTKAWPALVQDVGCTNSTNELACVKAVPALKIKEAIEKRNSVWAPVADGGKTMEKDVRDSITSGKAAKVPIIIGTNANEGTAFMAIGQAASFKLADIIAEMASEKDLGEAAVIATAELYPQDKYPNEFEHGAALFTDVGFQCPTALLTQTFADKGYNIRRYFYSAVLPELYPVDLPLRAWHSGEISPVFKTYDSKYTRVDRLSGVLQAAWTGLAKNPNGEIADWPAFKTGEEWVKQFGVEGDKVVKSADIDEHCATAGPLAETQGI